MPRRPLILLALALWCAIPPGSVSAGARLEGWGLLAATLVVLAALTLYVRANGREDTRAVLYDWQVSAFDGLLVSDEAFYN